MNPRPQRAGLPGRHYAPHHPLRSEVLHVEALHPEVLYPEVHRHLKKPVRVMKFGGTSVGDASCIARVVEIVRNASRESQIVVVVSAMSGVTNKLVEAATQSEAGLMVPVASILEGIRRQHQTAIDTLIHAPAERTQFDCKMKALFQEGDRLCQGTSLLGELTPRSRDAISALGERLSAPLVAAALAEGGVASVAIEATQLVVTDSCHGAAEPCVEQTRDCCEDRLRPLLDQNVVPVITGFIGATPEGILTTLGRGGSDYSATIVAAALRADEVIIWTDVDGLQTADPRLVADARTIPEISYREASELAYFGAKVLHPKTLRALMQSGIPLWIRNTFAPQWQGTRITPAGPGGEGAVKAVAAMDELVLIKLGGPGMIVVPDMLGRSFRTAAAVRAEPLLISQSSSQNELCMVIPAALVPRTVDALRHEFSHELAHEKTEPIVMDSTVAMVSVVGQPRHGVLGRSVLGRTSSALDRENINIIAIAQGANECTLSFVVARQDMKAALVSLHQEFQLAKPSHRVMAEHAIPPPCYQGLLSGPIVDQGTQTQGK
jgi:aspartokinase/homoserine dehydrogenase 1